MKQFIDKLTALEACDGEGQAMPWVCEQPDVETVYRECKRGDWMLWYIYKSGIALQDKRKWIGCKVEIALQVQHLMKDERSIKALEMAELYSKGQATEEELKQATAAAYDAYSAAYSAAAAYDAAYAAATDDAAAAATAYVDAAAYTAAAAYDAAYAAADDDAADAADAEKHKSLADSADIVRKWYSLEELL